MRIHFIIALFVLSALCLPAQPQQQDIPPLSDDVINSVCQLTAWAFGQESVSGQHRSLVRLELLQAWMSNDTQTIFTALEIPNMLQMIALMEPQGQEMIRQQMRQELLAGAQADPSAPTSQVVRDLASQFQAAPAQQAIPQQVLATPQAGIAPLTEQIVTDTGRLVAFAFGRASLPPQHQPMVREALNEVWASGDVQAIQVCAQIPLICEQIESQPALLEQSRAQWRQFMMGTAAQDPQSSFAQLISQLSGQPIQAWAGQPGQGGTFEDQAGLYHTPSGMQQNTQMEHDWNSWQQQDNLMYDQQVEQQQQFDQQYEQQNYDSGSYDSGSYDSGSYDTH